MKALIIILIVLLIVQTAIYAWCDLLQFLRGKREAILQETMKNVQKDFMSEKERLRELIDKRDELILSLDKLLKEKEIKIKMLERRLKIKRELEEKSFEHSEVK